MFLVIWRYNFLSKFVKFNSGTGNSSVNESGDYGIFSGKIDSELLIQSIEAAMPKKLLFSCLYAVTLTAIL